MNKFKVLVAIVALVVGVQTVSFALQSNTVDTAKNSAQQVSKSAGVDKALEMVVQASELSKRYETNFRTCEPIHVSQNIEVFGFKMNYAFNINGWVNDKCSYDMNGRISALGKDIRDVFQFTVSDETLAKFEPKIKCDFTQEQLNILVDGVKAMESSTKTSEDLKDATSPAKVRSPEEEKMIQLLVSGNACVITNQEELMQTLSEIMGTPSLIAPSASECDAPTLRPGAEEEAPKVNMPSAPQY